MVDFGAVDQRDADRNGEDENYPCVEREQSSQDLCSHFFHVEGRGI